MTTWQQRNAAYLQASLAWLRLRLEQAAGATDRAQQIDAAEKQRRKAAAGDPPVALEALAMRLGMSPFERDTLLLCGAAEIDTGLPALFARVQGDPARPGATFALAMLALPEPAWEALAPHRPLRFWRLVEIFQPAAQPLTTSAMRADERIVRFLQGIGYLDDRLQPFVEPLDVAAPPDELAPSQRAVAGAIVRGLQERAAAGRLPVVELLGAATRSKRMVAAAVCAELGLAAYRLPAELLPPAPGELGDLARLWQRESLLMPLALYLDEGAGAGDGDPGRAAAPGRFLDRLDGVVFHDRRSAGPGGGREAVGFAIAHPTAAEQRAHWASLLDDDGAAQLAGQFNLDSAAIERIGRAAGGAGDNATAAAWERCLEHTRPQLDTLARPVDARATWDDLVLPDEQAALLRRIADQVRGRSTVYDEWGFRRRMNRGLGVSALFTGESGTGKTMAAEVLANELGLGLYRIDLSQVVSKYIGETEKNLRRVFDAAEDGGAILFFDEADALFGRRSEVKDSHDRYANIEINYLLQRMEAYGGLAILATNMRSALDEAFLRRLRFVVSFPFPAAAERRRIWELAFPRADGARGLPGAPLAGLDYGHLAGLSLSGGEIHNIALSAAFAAAAQGSPVTMSIVLGAARVEFAKLERPAREAAFAWPPAR